VFNQEVVVPFPAGAIDFSPSDVCRQAPGPKQPITRQVLLDDKAAGASSYSPQWARTSSFTRFLDHTQRRDTVGRTPLDEWSARRRDLYLTTHNTHNRQTSMPRVGFQPTISAGERPQTYTLDGAATGDQPNEHSVKPHLQTVLCTYGGHRTSLPFIHSEDPNAVS